MTEKREIRFRAWDTEHKRMLIPAMPLIGGGLSWGKTGYDAGGRDYVLEQFTGLYDKNGGEIYVGDIMESPMEYPDGVKLLYPVGYTLTTYSSAFDFGPLPKLSTCVVVGNIHETHELLK
jgi:hypothetical protein